MTLTQINKAGLDEIALDHVFTIGASGSSAYTFQGEGLNGTVNNPTLYLTRGKTYRFENGSGGHPIRIQSTSGASGTAYNTGVTNNAGSGTVIVEVQHDAPDVLYYQCTSHAAMNGILYITGALADGGVTTAKIANGAVTAAKILAGNVTTVNIGDNAVTTTKIADDAVDHTKLAAGAANTAAIGNGAVTNAKIIDDAITTGKIADNAVTNAKVQDTAITTGKLANNAVTNAKLADDSVSTARIIDGAVNANKLGTAVVTTAKIEDGAVTSAKIADGTIVNADISNSALIQGGKIAEMISGNSNNRVITATGSTNSFQGETSLTYDGSGTLEISDNGSAYILTGPGTTKHEIAASASDNDLVIQNNKSGGNVTSNIIFKGSAAGGSTPSEKLRITDQGVGINHNTSGASTNAALTIQNRTGSSATRFNLVNAGSSGVESTQIFSQNNELAFTASGSERFRITSGGVTFNGDTASSNKLNDYETGSWTPQLWRAGGSSEITSLTGRYGYYCLVGDMLQLSFYWYSNSLTDNTGTAYVIRNLPYNVLYSHTGAYQFIPGGYYYMMGNSVGDHATTGTYRWQANGTFGNNTLTLYSSANAMNASGAVEFSGCGVIRII